MRTPTADPTVYARRPRTHEPQLRARQQPYPEHVGARSVQAMSARAEDSPLRAALVRCESQRVRCPNPAAARPRKKPPRSRPAASSISPEHQHAVAAAEAEREAQGVARFTLDVVALDLWT